MIRTSRRLTISLAAIAAVVIGIAPALAETPPRKALEARNGMVVCASPPAADVGLATLQAGGNAVDAAVATALAMAVTYPIAGNIGGGGFMMVHPPKGEPIVIEYRESAPAAATVDMFAKGVNRYGHKVVGVPGTVRGLELAHKKFGRLPWKQVVAPAIKLAAEGFPLEPWSARSLNNLVADAPNHAELRRVLGKDGGHGSWQAGDVLKQPDLARTLTQIAEHGSDGFYSGPVAEAIEAEMKSGDGLITKADLSNYKAHERRPVHGTFRGYDVYSSSPPAGGGIGLIESLNVLENYDLKKLGRWSPQTLHLMAETMRRAFCDRAYYLGDPEFNAIPEHLTSKQFAKLLAGTIKSDHATPSEKLARDIPITNRESDNTTHFSIIDKDGLAVANTYTLEHSYGSRIVVRGAGFLLNNEMMDFNHQPGVTTRQGAIGTKPNLIAPNKRMLSSQTPTIVAKNGKVFLITGSPGGRTIPNTVLCVLLNVLEFNMEVQAAVDAPRCHHQWFPDELKLERMRENVDVVDKLKAMGHRIVSERSQGDAHTILVDPATGAYRGAADRRIMGKAAGY